MGKRFGMKSLLRLLARLPAFLAAASLAFAPMPSAAAGRQGLPIVRDAEIEALIGDYVGPILKAAGLSPSRVDIILINDPSYNAFVAGRRIFINTGTILNSATPNEVIGVLAHEIGHLAGGHQQRMRDQIERAKTIAVVASLLGAGVAVAGAASGTRGLAQAGAGIMSGGGSVAQRGLFSYMRSEETTADRSALTYLRKTGQSARGLIESLKNLERSRMFSSGPSNRYLSSHPAPRERIAALEALAKESPYYDEADSLAMLKRHDLARAKIAAYDGGAMAVRRLFSFDPRGQAAAYGEAIATHLAGSPAQALGKIDALIAESPSNPWFHEIRGEILMQSGRSDAAAAAFGKAAALDPSHSGLLQASVGQAIVTGGDPARMREAIEQIRKGLRADPENSTAYRFLSMAYGKIGEVGPAELAMAEGYWHAGAFRDAKVFAARAQQKLKPGSPAWLQAEDIIRSKQ